MKFYALTSIALMVYVVGIYADGDICRNENCYSQPEKLVCALRGSCYDELHNQCLAGVKKECDGVPYRRILPSSCAAENIPQNRRCLPTNNICDDDTCYRLGEYPICAYNGTCHVSFFNECVMNVYVNCDNQPWEIVSPNKESCEELNIEEESMCTYL